MILNASACSVSPQITGVVNLPAGSYVSVWLNIPTSYNSPTYVQSETGFSAAYLGPNQPHPGVHADTTSQLRVTSGGWKEITNWGVGYTASNGLYSTDNSWAGGRYTAGAPGIYYVSTNVRLDYATRSQYGRVVIAVNGNPDINNGLHAIEGYTATFVTMAVSGFVRLLSGDTVSVYAYTQDTSYQISTQSGFSVNRMGSEFDRPAFLADLLSSRTITTANRFLTLTNWTTQGNYGLFQSDLNFNPVTGTFTAPENGYYAVSGQVRFDNTQANAYYRVLAVINNAPSVNNGLHSIRGTTATRVPYFTETVAGTVYMTAGQKLTLMVFGNRAPYTINQESGFSVCKLNNVVAGFQGDLGGSVNVNRRGWTSLTRTWRTTGTPGLFNLNFRNTAGRMTVPATGVYLVAANVSTGV